MAKVNFSCDSLHLLELVIEDGDVAIGISIGLRLMHGLLQRVAERALEINDDELNRLMLRLGLYEVQEDAHVKE